MRRRLQCCRERDAGRPPPDRGGARRAQRQRSDDEGGQSVQSRICRPHVEFRFCHIAGKQRRDGRTRCTQRRLYEPQQSTERIYRSHRGCARFADLGLFAGDDQSAGARVPCLRSVERAAADAGAKRNSLHAASLSSRRSMSSSGRSPVGRGRSPTLTITPGRRRLPRRLMPPRRLPMRR